MGGGVRLCDGLSHHRQHRLSRSVLRYGLAHRYLDFGAAFQGNHIGSACVRLAGAVADECDDVRDKSALNNLFPDRHSPRQAHCWNGRLDFLPVDMAGDLDCINDTGTACPYVFDELIENSLGLGGQFNGVAREVDLRFRIIKPTIIILRLHRSRRE